ncbi:MAG: HAMP domain-containing protein [Desulfuromonadales bacterium]|nr:HAMP domain-containing protein [Desulfuromonadales bacterium]
MNGWRPPRPQPGRFSFHLSLRTKLAALMLATSFSLVAILVLYYYQTEKALYSEFQRRTAELSKAVQIGIEGASSKNLNDIRDLEKYLDRLNPEGVREISVISSADRIVASTRQDSVGKWITERRKELIFKAELGEPVTGDGPVYNVIIPVSSESGTLGYIHLTLDAKDFSVLLRDSAIRRAGAALGILAIGTVIALVLAGRYTRPIVEIATAAARVADGDLTQEMAAGRRDEIGVLSRSFNDMVAKLREDRDLRERLRTAEHLASVGQFAQSIAHEIKNPLNFINLSIDHMRDSYRPADPQTAARFESLVGNIKGEIQRLRRFAESYLEYGRPFELRRRQTALQPLVEGVLELSAARAEAAGVRVEADFRPLPELHLDPEFIRTCLLNLVANAFEAMPAGGLLSVRTELNGATVAIVCTDSGTGVERELLEKVFEPFFTTKSGGLGLGLALTRKVVEEHGGRVEFDSRPGEGSVVTLFLPVEREVRR